MKYDITRFHPCIEWMEYYASQPSFGEAWRNCPRGEWMLWIADKLGVDIRLLTRAKALCANTVRHLMRDPRSTDAVDAALRYAAGEIDEQALKRFERAAYEAYDEVTSSDKALTDALTIALAAAAYAAYAAADGYSYCSVASTAIVAIVYEFLGNAKQRDEDEAVKLKITAICRELLTDAVREKVGAAWSSRGKKSFAPPTTGQGKKSFAPAPTIQNSKFIIQNFKNHEPN